ncbi:hypothetical protein HP439_19055, partial [Sphingobacterium shayense]|uniref:phthiocerol/phthiodiolone dimycocerosyl transferase family protein n=1 Tax=Sphingobacterium shayense TaxID=626343 RepID=UPI0015570974
MSRRSLLLVERIMYVDPITPLNCVFAAKIKGNIPEENFNIALYKIQQKHPMLRTVIENQEDGHPVFVLKENIEPIPLRMLERKTDEDWISISREQWGHLFDNPKKPLAKVLWIKGDSVSEIILVMPHCVCDGATCVTLMRELFSLLDDSEVNLQSYPMFRSVNEFLPADFDVKRKKRKAKLYLFLARIFFFMQLKGKKRNLGDNYVIHWKLDSVATANIIERCKAHGLSVHALLCAAFMNAFRQLQAAASKGKVICPVDIRRFIPEIKQDHLFAFAPTVELSLKKGSNSLLDSARQIKTELTGKIQKLNARELLWMGERMHPVLGKMISLLRSTRGGHDVTLSNMGNIDIPRTYKNFEVETVYSPTVAFPWLNSNTLVVSTFGGQMDFS